MVARYQVYFRPSRAVVQYSKHTSRAGNIYNWKQLEKERTAKGKAGKERKEQERTGRGRKGKDRKGKEKTG